MNKGVLFWKWVNKHFTQFHFEPQFEYIEFNLTLYVRSNTADIRNKMTTHSTLLWFSLFYIFFFIVLCINYNCSLFKMVGQVKIFYFPFMVDVNGHCMMPLANLTYLPHTNFHAIQIGENQSLWFAIKDKQNRVHSTAIWDLINFLKT